MSSPLRFLADEDFNNDIIRGLLRRSLALDLVRVQDVGLSGEEDARVLEEACRTSRIVLTHDVSTMTGAAYRRLIEGLPLAGVFIISQDDALGVVIDEIHLLIECSTMEDWEGQVVYIPLR